MASGIDIVSRMYQMLHTPELITALGGEYLWQHNWPQNSDKTEVCISIPTTDAYESDLKFIDIDIRTPNLGTDGKDDYHPFPGKPQDNTFPDLYELKRITDIVLPLIVTQGDFYVVTRIPGVPRRDSDGRWIVNIRVEFTLLDTQDTHTVSLIDYIAEPDGFAGYQPSAMVAWQGTAQRQTINENPHLDKTAGVYGLYLKCSWLVPMDEVTPKKRMQLITDEGEYIITGIFPEGIFWKLTTTRKDADYPN